MLWLALALALVTVALGVALVVAGLDTHPEVKIGRHTYPLSTINQFKPLRGNTPFPVVQVGRTWWEIVTGGPVIVIGLVEVAYVGGVIRRVRAKLRALPASAPKR